MSSGEKPARYGRSRFAIACAALRLVEIQACKRPLVYRGMALRPYAATIGGTDSYVIEASGDTDARNQRVWKLTAPRNREDGVFCQ
jgi:hypothetical protein